MTRQPVTKHEFTESPESPDFSCSGQALHIPFTSPLLPTLPDSTGSSGAHVKQPLSTNDSQSSSTAREENRLEVRTDSVQEAGLKEEVRDEDGVPDAVRTTDPCKVSESSAHHPTLSLFSGMDLINRGKPVCLVEPVLMEPEAEEKLFWYAGVNKEKSIERTPRTSANSELESAFSFLNL